MIHQLRIYCAAAKPLGKQPAKAAAEPYEIFEHNKAAFHARFRDQWREIKRVTAARHGDLVGAIEDRTLEEV